jgi:hypothetical protein
MFTAMIMMRQAELTFIMNAQEFLTTMNMMAMEKLTLETMEQLF